MYRMVKTLPSLAIACVLATALAACNSSPSAPTRPEAVGIAVEVGPNGETLKVSAPGVVGPTNNLRIDSRKPTMVVNNVQAKFAGASFTYEFELLTDGNTRIAGTTVNASGGTASWAYPTDLERDTAYRWRARARLGSNVGPWTGASRFVTVFEKRAADPAPGTRLPFPSWGAAIVSHVAAQRPDLIRNSCQEHGGSWGFMDAVVDALRAEDSRFGYNCKRGNCNDPSYDVVAYNYTNGPDEGNTGVYIIDIVLGHCGPAPGPGWGDVTAVTVNSGTVGRFTSRGRW